MRDSHVCIARRLLYQVDPVLRVDFRQRPLIAGVFRQREVPLLEFNLEFALERSRHVALDDAGVRALSQRGFEVNDACMLWSRCLSQPWRGRHTHGAPHIPAGAIDQQDTLIQQRISVNRATPAGNHAAIGCWCRI